MSYSERIRSLREDHDKTQAEIAGLLQDKYLKEVHIQYF